MTLLVVLPGLLLRTKVLCWAGLVVLWLASTALVGDTAMRAAEGWQIRVPVETLPSSQAIVVLSGRLVEPPGDAPLGEWSDAVDRFDAGVALFQAGKAPILVCTGGWVPWSPAARPEGEVLAERAAMLGVPRRHILVTDKVANTADEARAVAQPLQDRLATTAQAQIILVTSAFHMRRSRVRCARAGFQVMPFPVACRVAAGRACTLLDLRPEASSLRQTATALRAWSGCLSSQLVGRCTESAPRCPAVLVGWWGAGGLIEGRRRAQCAVAWTAPGWRCDRCRKAPMSGQRCSCWSPPEIP